MIKKWVVFINEEGVIKLLRKFLPQGFQAGEIDNELILVEPVRAKPECEASAISVYESAVSTVSPLTVTAGKSIKALYGLVHW